MFYVLLFTFCSVDGGNDSTSLWLVLISFTLTAAVILYFYYDYYILEHDNYICLQFVHSKNLAEMWRMQRETQPRVQIHKTANNTYIKGARDQRERRAIGCWKWSSIMHSWIGKTQNRGLLKIIYFILAFNDTARI